MMRMSYAVGNMACSDEVPALGVVTREGELVRSDAQ